MELFSLTATDFGPYEKFTLPLYKQGLIWVGGVNKDTSAADSNGSGKSSLFKALVWGLYGDSIDGEKGDKVIRCGAKKAVVDVCMVDDDKQQWIIRRFRTKGTPRLELIKPDGEKFKIPKGEIQSHINDMIGLDFKSFKNTVLYGQNDSSRFAHPKTKDSERKLMLHSILRTELLSECHEEAKILTRNIRIELSDIQIRIDKLQTRIDEHDLEEIKTSARYWDVEKNSLIKGLKNEYQVHRSRSSDYLKKIESLSKQEEVDVKPLRNELERLNLRLKECEVIKDKVQELSEFILKFDSDLGSLGKKISCTENELKNILRQLSKLEGDNCPLCTAPLKTGKANTYLREIKKKREEISREIEKLSSEYYSMSEERKNALKRKQELDEEISKSYQWSVRISSLKDKISKAEKFSDEIDNKIEILRNKAMNELELAKGIATRIKDEKTKENPFVEQLKVAKTKISGYKAEIKMLDVQQEARRNDLVHHEFWVKGFSSHGLPSFMLDGVMPYITDRTNHYLDTLSDGDITVNFSTQRELKSSKGEYRDEISVDWRIEGIDDAYPPSGGQLKKIEIAADLALMDLVATREHGHLDILMLDEVLDGLDSEGCSRVFQMLQALRAHRGTIFVISHESEVAEAFEKSINVVKEDGISRLVV